jgi:hypothetical protein
VIGGPLPLLTRAVTRAYDRSEFDKAYKEIINQGLILRMKKRTGKGSDWHISINPKKIKEVYESING